MVAPIVAAVITLDVITLVVVIVLDVVADAGPPSTVHP